MVVKEVKKTESNAIINRIMGEEDPSLSLGMTGLFVGIRGRRGGSSYEPPLLPLS